MPKKLLPDLYHEYENCTKCDLSARRIELGTPIVFGTGYPRGIMFIGEGPGKEEETAGAPFVGRSGKLLLRAVNKLALDFKIYITNLIKCRSCEHTLNENGEPMFKIDRRTQEEIPIIKDIPPADHQIDTCLPLLYQQIYIVDPVLIIALGGEVAKALSGKRSLKITTDRGSLFEITIPGMGSVPDLTDKKKAWARKVKGEIFTPVETRQVKYLMIPVVHPAHVLRRQADESRDSPKLTFIRDIRYAIRVFDKYCEEAQGKHPAERELNEEDMFNAEE